MLSTNVTVPAAAVMQFFRGLTSHAVKKTDISSDLRKMMQLVPTAVVVLTGARHHNDMQGCSIKRGMTCSSFTSVSMKPPIISVCINKPSRIHDVLVKSRSFAINVLAKDQAHYAVFFSKPVNDGINQLEEIPHLENENGIPLLQGAASVLQCSAIDCHEVGDHHVWYGQVTEVNTAPGIEPLLYYARSFRSVGDEAFIQAFQDRTLLFEDWTHEAHIRMAWNYIKEFGEEEAMPMIKYGILRFNEKNHDKISRGYHETITMFYIKIISHYMKQHETEATFEEFIADFPEIVDRYLPFQYYTKDCLETKNARERFVPPDIQPLPVSK